MAKVKVTYSTPGGETMDIEFENGDGLTISDVMEAAGFGAGGKFALNGEPADADTPVGDEDIVSQSKTAEGN